jgi:ribonuclease HII
VRSVTFTRPAAVPPDDCFMMGASVEAMTTAACEVPPATATATAPPAAPSAAPTAAATARRRKVAARRRSSGRRLFAHDRRLGVRWVAGADEAGRGCLAGPLVAAGVLFDMEALTTRELRALSRLNDSKQHTHEVREELFPIVMRTASKVCVVSRCARTIDARGLHKTNLAALRDALIGVARPGCICLSDGFAVGKLPHEQRAIVEGDATSAAIAAASIVAKVTRDRYMRRADALHPGWEFAAHVGYSTPEHREAIQRLGVSPLHRLSFASTAYQQLAL